MNNKSLKTKLDAANLEELKLGRDEYLRQAQSSFDDAWNILQYAIAIQYLIDQEKGTETHSRVIAKTIEEMIEDLYYYHSVMDDPGEEAYGEMTKACFDETVRTVLCADGLEAEWERRKSIRERKERGEQVFDNESR